MYPQLVQPQEVTQAYASELIKEEREARVALKAALQLPNRYLVSACDLEMMDPLPNWR